MYRFLKVNLWEDVKKWKNSTEKKEQLTLFVEDVGLDHDAVLYFKFYLASKVKTDYFRGFHSISFDRFTEGDTADEFEWEKALWRTTPIDSSLVGFSNIIIVD